MPPQGQAPPRVLRNLRVRRVQLTSRSGVLKQARSRVKPGENARREGGLAEQFRVSALHIRPLGPAAKRLKVVPPHPLLLKGLPF